MAEKSRKIRISSDDDGRDVSFEAADAVPVMSDDADDERTGRQPIDLDAPIDLSAAMADADRSPAPDEDDGAPQVMDAPAPPAGGKEVAELRAQLGQANDEKLRALADLQNFRRRSEEERVRIIRDANERLIRELLPVLDDFDLAVNAAKQSQSYEQLIGGVEAILRKLNETLAKQGVVPIPSVGEQFDPDLHEAVMLDEEADAPEETVTSELRKGYMLNKRVLRPSLVKVAKGG